MASELNISSKHLAHKRQNCPERIVVILAMIMAFIVARNEGRARAQFSERNRAVICKLRASPFCNKNEQPSAGSCCRESLLSLSCDLETWKYFNSTKFISYSIFTNNVKNETRKLKFLRLSSNSPKHLY